MYFVTYEISLEMAYLVSSKYIWNFFSLSAERSSKSLILGATIGGAALCLLLLVAIMFKQRTPRHSRKHGDYAPLNTDDKLPIM